MDLVIREVNNTIQIRSAGQLSCDYVTYKKLIKLFLLTKQKQIKQQTDKDGITITLLFNHSIKYPIKFYVYKFINICYYATKIHLETTIS